MSAPIVLALRILLALILYGFMGWALLTLWKDLQTQKNRLSFPTPPKISLSKQSQSTSETFIFEIPEILLGRDPTCTLKLDDQTISARHAKLTYHHSQWWVKDLDSTNGTFLNQERIEEQHVITSGDILQFGEVVFEIRTQAAGPDE
jgi:pSer/pThr/pTyr-binding forkhead associated (FHA) protein